jgi:beta-lactamase class A
MERNLSRRTLLSALGGGAVCVAAPELTRAAARSMGERLVSIERASGGRLGVFVLDTASGRSTGHRMDERFGLCSTFKLLLAVAVLREADAGRLSLDQHVTYTQRDLVPYAPVAEKHLSDGGMIVGALAEAAQVMSDNVAANLLLRLLGGPEGFTRILRELGDDVTRLDRYEPEMNFVPAGELRDTTTPRAVAATVSRALTGDVLRVVSRAKLIDWMVATRTGLRRLRAGFPQGWRAGDKTGTGSMLGMPNKHNDVAIVWPPGRAPCIVAAYLDARGHFEKNRAADDAVLADVGRAAADWIVASA